MRVADVLREAWELWGEVLPWSSIGESGRRDVKRVARCERCNGHHVLWTPVQPASAGVTEFKDPVSGSRQGWVKLTRWERSLRVSEIGVQRWVLGRVV